MSKVVAVIQARMGSSRLSGKSLMDVAGKPLLQHVVERIGEAQYVDEVVIATTSTSVDDPIRALAAHLGIRCVSGSEHDVFSRYLKAVRESGAEVVMRITGDCPLIDPRLSDEVVSAYFDQKADYAANIIERTLPRGADTEVFSAAKFTTMDSSATEPRHREHVTPYFREHPELFRLASVEGKGELRRPDLRLCVDTGEDLELIRGIFEMLGGETNNLFGLLEVVRLMDREPWMKDINAHIEQKKS